jgi:hypothetical protein
MSPQLKKFFPTILKNKTANVSLYQGIKSTRDSAKSAKIHYNNVNLTLKWSDFKHG